MFDFQTIAAVTLVLAAAAYLAWRGVCLMKRRRTAGCGSACNDCPSSLEVKPNVVQITKKSQ
jgi:hypothetical protein